MKILEFKLNKIDKLAEFLAMQTEDVVDAKRWLEIFEIFWVRNPYIKAEDALGWYIEDDGQIQGFLGRVKFAYQYNDEEIQVSLATSWYVSDKSRYMGMGLLNEFLSLKDVLISINAINNVKKILQSNLCNFLVLGPNDVCLNYIPVTKRVCISNGLISIFKILAVNITAILFNFLSGINHTKIQIDKTMEYGLDIFQEIHIKDILYFKLNNKNIEWIKSTAGCNIWGFKIENNLIGYIVWKSKNVKNYAIVDVIDYFFINLKKEEALKIFKKEIDKKYIFSFIKISGNLNFNVMNNKLIYKKIIYKPNLYLNKYDDKFFKEIVQLNPDMFAI